MNIMKIAKMALILLVVSLLPILAYAENADSLGKIDINNKVPEIIGLQFINDSFEAGDVVYCTASIRDLNNDTLALNASMYDTLHSSSYPNYNFTTSQFICSGQWIDTFGKFCYVGVTNIAGNVGIWICNFTASDNITSASASAIGQLVIPVTTTISTTTTAPTGGGAGGQGGEAIKFDLSELQINSIQLTAENTTQINSSFLIQNKGFQNPIEIVVNQKITYLAELRIFVDYTDTIELNVEKNVSSILIPTENLPDGLYKYEVYIYAKNKPQISAKSDITFRFSPEKGTIEVQEPTPIEKITKWVTSSDINLWLLIISIAVAVIAVITLYLIFKKK